MTGSALAAAVARGSSCSVTTVGRELPYTTLRLRRHRASGTDFAEHSPGDPVACHRALFCNIMYGHGALMPQASI